MTNLEYLLAHVECEYKYGLNADYQQSFMADFCAAFNLFLQSYYESLPAAFAERYPREAYELRSDLVVEETLDNSYFDTAQDTLFRSYSAGLRLRRSSHDDEVEQTIKYRTQHLDQGIAHNNVELNVRTSLNLQSPDLSLFTAADLPHGLLTACANQEFICKYQTIFTRSKLLVTIPYWLSFEVALDQGAITAGDLATPICEVEFELKAIDSDYLKANLGRSIYDFADLRLEFSSIIHRLLLLLSGSNAPLLHFTALPASSAASANAATAATATSAATAAAATASSNAASVNAAMLKVGGVIGLEPFSKLKRAVLLKLLGHVAPSREDEAARSDVPYYRSVVSQYASLVRPTLTDFNHAVQKLTEGFINAVGYANLFGTRDNFADVLDMISMLLSFSAKHQQYVLNDYHRNMHQQLVGLEPLLSDQSMSAIKDSASKYIELNLEPLLQPFADALKLGLERQDFNKADFRALSRTVLANSFTILCSDFLERLIYIQERQLRVLSGPSGDNAAYRLMVQATQYHLHV